MVGNLLLQDGSWEGTIERDGDLYMGPFMRNRMKCELPFL